MFVVLAQALCVCAILCWSAAPARGQSLAFTPGLAGTYAGDPTQSHGPSSASYTGPLNNWSNNYQNGTGLVMTTPTEVAFDSNGNVYDVERILNSGYSYVVRVFASGKGAIPAVPGAGSSPQAGYVYPAAGNGTQALSSTCATATDTYGNGCAATDVDFQNAGAPLHIAIDASGNIYIMDTFANEIRVIYGGGSIPGLPANPVPGHIYALAGNGTAGSSGDGGPALGAELSTPDGVAVDGHGNIYFSEAGNDIVRVVYAGGSVPGLPSSPTAGNLYTIAGTVGSTCNYGSSTCGDEGPATAAQFGFYIGSVGVDPSGNIYIADTNNTRVRAIYAAGTLPGISSPTVGDIYTIAGAGSLSGSATPGVPATNFKLKAPAYLAFDPAGDVYISDGQSDEVYKVDSGGILTLVFGGGTGCATQTYTNGDGCAANAATLNAPTGIALDSSGNLYVADQQSNVIREADTALTALVFTGTYGLTVPSQVLTLSNTGIQPLQLIKRYFCASSICAGRYGRFDGLWQLHPDCAGSQLPDRHQRHAHPGWYNDRRPSGEQQFAQREQRPECGRPHGEYCSRRQQYCPHRFSRCARAGEPGPACYLHRDRPSSDWSRYYPDGNCELQQWSNNYRERNREWLRCGNVYHQQPCRRIVCGDGCVRGRYKLQHKQFECCLCDCCFSGGSHCYLDGVANQHDSRTIRYAYSHRYAARWRRCANGHNYF